MDIENSKLKNMSKSKLFVGLGVLILLVLVLVLGYMTFVKNNQSQKSYSVVYLTSGEVYVGQLSLFPKMSLSNVYLLQVAKDSKDASKNNFSLAPLKESLWSPNRVYLNRGQVIFYGKVGEGSKIAETLKQAK
ncbi:MAG: hypothetical protein AAB824_01695 [Patescibacteria group bacterium]